MLRCVGLVLLFRSHEPPTVQDSQGLLDGALGEARIFGDVAVAEPHARRRQAARVPPKKQIDKKSRRRSIVADQITKEHVHQVMINRKGSRRRRYHRKYYSRF